MTTDLFLDFIGIRMDSSQVGDMEFTINLVTPDNGEKFVIELSNATLTNIEGYQAENPDLTITINRSDLVPVMAGQRTLAAQIADGKAKVEGNQKVLEQLASLLVNFEMGFEIMPGTATKPDAARPKTANYEERRRFPRIRRWLEKRRLNAYQHQNLGIPTE